MELGFRSITVAIDGSEHAGHALAVAIDLARRYSARLTVVSVAPILPTLVMPNEPMMPPIPPETTLPRFRELVEAAVAQARGSGLTAVDGLSIEGPPVDELLEVLSKHPTDLLVVGSRGLSAAKRLLLGSVSAALVNRAPCPVLVVRPTPTPPSPPA
jgi:nucleotide-binding universal stress UspA family protein